MAIYKASVLVLRRIPLGEKDKIITLFSRELGKLRAVAKGARKPTSKLSGATEPLLLLRADCSTPKSEASATADMFAFLAHNMSATWTK